MADQTLDEIIARKESLTKELSDIEASIARLTPVTIDELFEQFADEDGVIRFENNKQSPDSFSYYYQNWSTPVTEGMRKLGYEINPQIHEIYRTPPTTLYKFTREGGVPSHGGTGNWSVPVRNDDGTWRPGDWREVTESVVICSKGLHLSDARQMEQWWSAEMYVAEVEGLVLKGEGKYVVRKARLIRRVTANFSARSSAREIHYARIKAALDGQPEMFGLLPKDYQDTLATLGSFAEQTDWCAKQAKLLLADNYELQAKQIRTGENTLPERRNLKEIRDRLARLGNHPSIDQSYIPFLQRTKSITENEALALYRAEYDEIYEEEAKITDWAPDADDKARRVRS